MAARSPYAIAHFAGTYNGWTFPNTPEARAFLDKVLSAARAYLVPGVTIGPPASTRIAGMPARLAPRLPPRGVRDGALRQAGAAAREGRQDGRVYHSTCGDQFGWTPPHDAASAGIASPSEEARRGGRALTGAIPAWEDPR